METITLEYDTLQEGDLFIWDESGIVDFVLSNDESERGGAGVRSCLMITASTGFTCRVIMKGQKGVRIEAKDAMSWLQANKPQCIARYKDDFTYQLWVKDDSGDRSPLPELYANRVNANAAAEALGKWSIVLRAGYAKP